MGTSLSNLRRYHQFSFIATSERANTAPASIYTATRLAQKDLVRIDSQALGIPVVIPRLQNVYGEGSRSKIPTRGFSRSSPINCATAKRSLFTKMARRAWICTCLRCCEERQPRRSLSLAVHLDATDGCTLNVGSGAPTSIAQIALLLRKRLDDKTERSISGQYRFVDIRRGYTDIREIDTKLSFVPEKSLEQSLDRLFVWLQTQPLEPDRVDIAAQEPVVRGIMQESDTHSASM